MIPLFNATQARQIIEHALTSKSLPLQGSATAATPEAAKNAAQADAMYLLTLLKTLQDRPAVGVEVALARRRRGGRIGATQTN